MYFSIIIPTYNRKYKIYDAIQSLEKQTFSDFEILVVDDGSSDGTGEFIRSLEIENLSYFYKTNGGKHTALNLGIKKAKGNLLIILDSDDVLVPTALEEMAQMWDKVKNNKSICGLMGRSIENNTLIGKPFIEDSGSMSYLEYHFGKNSSDYKDCCECLRTSILRQFSWPEDDRTKFVPESLVTDQIGLDYKLICTNFVWKKVTYLEDGITKNVNQYLRNNSVGYLYDVISKIDDIFPKYKVSMRTKISYWWTYWNLRALCKNEKDLKVKKLQVSGIVIKLLLPFLNWRKGWK